MGFYELGNGCDTCDTVSSVVPNNMNMQMDPNSHMVASMGMPYGTQNNVPKQYNNSVSAGYGNQGLNMGSNMGSNTNSYMGPTIQTTQPTMVMVPATVSTTTTSNGQIIKQVSTPNSLIAQSQKYEPTLSTHKLEGFTDGTSQAMQSSKMWLVLGLVIFSALAGNECCKYFLNKSLQLNDGSPLYYVAYLAVAVLLTYASYTYAIKK